MFLKTLETQRNNQVPTPNRRAHALISTSLAIIGLAAGVPPLLAQPVPYPEDIEVVRKLLDINGLTDVSVSAVIQTTISPTGEERVGEIKLSNKQVTQVPPEIGALAALEELDLSNNNIRALPDSFGQLSSLTKLNLSHNRLAALPSTFSQLNNLKDCRLEYNQLKAMPDMSRLVFLNYLNLSHNVFDAFPPSLVLAAALTTLDVSHNQLRNLPIRLGMMTGLKRLYAGNNQIATIPSSIVELNKLILLDLPYNRLREAPGFLGRLDSLKILNLNNNLLVALPDGLTQLTGLNAYSPIMSAPPPDPLNLAGNQICQLEGPAADWADSFDTDWRELQNCDTNYLPGLLPWKKLAPLPGKTGPGKVNCALSLGGTYLAGADDGLWRHTAKGWTREWQMAPDVYTINCIESGKAARVYAALSRRDTAESGLYLRSGEGVWSPCDFPARITALTRDPDSLLVAAAGKDIFRQLPDLSWVLLESAFDIDSLPVANPWVNDLTYIQNLGFCAKVHFVCASHYCTQYIFTSFDGLTWRLLEPRPKSQMPVDFWNGTSLLTPGPEELTLLFNMKFRTLDQEGKFGTLMDMSLGPQGAILAVTTRGVFDLSAWRLHRCDKGLPKLGLTSIGVTPEGRFYVGGDSGLYVNESWTTQSASLPLFPAQRQEPGSTVRYVNGRICVNWTGQFGANIRMYNPQGTLVFSSGRLSAIRYKGYFEFTGKRMGEGVFFYTLSCFGQNGTTPAPRFIGRLTIF